MQKAADAPTEFAPLADQNLIVTAFEFARAYALAVTDSLHGLFASPSSFFGPLPVLTAFCLGALILSWRARAHAQPLSLGALWRSVFPPEIWRHGSARRDIAIIVINDGILFFIPLIAIVIVHLAVPVAGVATASGAASAPSTLEMIAYGVFIALAWDFFASYAHYLKHKIPLLWEFHKVHHSAEVLTPLTALRRHPFETFISQLIVGFGLAAANFLWFVLFGAPGSTMQVGGLALIIYLWRLLGYNLRHSHIWISYGPLWNNILISPAHHQLHHSRDPKHYDCNFGHIFSFWDRLFGTHYPPTEKENFEFGIDREENAELRSLRALYVRPVLRACARLRGRVH